MIPSFRFKPASLREPGSDNPLASSRGLFLWVIAPVVLAAACSSSSSPSKASGGNDAGMSGSDAAAESGVVTEAGSDAPAGPKIEHLIVIVQENQTFDSYFGNWCTAPTGSNPTCTQGAACCEAGPGLDPGSQTTPSALNDAFNAARDPNHLKSCELTEIDGGKMDGFVTSSVCGSSLNFAYGDTTLQPYWSLAAKSAVADRYFQPLVGASSANDMYLARAQFVFDDNDYEPEAIGSSCSLVSTTTQYTDTTIADLLDTAGVTWGWYAEGYDVMAAAVKNGTCPTATPTGCAFGGGTWPCGYDPGDVPFQYYKDLVDNPAHFKDYTTLATDLSGGTLPSVTFIKGYGFHSEHPGYGDTVSAGETFVGSTIAAISASSYAPSTLILLTWDEGGGHFDHVTPPAMSTVDNQPYGTRVPLLAIGPLAGVGTVSHVTMEHSSIVKFIEYNWLGATGQLNGRDAVVANIGSLLDPSLGVPAN